MESRLPVGRTRKTWLENVEADMAELEIDREDIHDRKIPRDTAARGWTAEVYCTTCIPYPSDGGINV